MMTNKEKKLEIINVITNIVRDRYRKHIVAKGEFEAEQTKERSWQNNGSSKWDYEYNGGFSLQAPNVELYRGKDITAQREFEKWESIYNYAMENLVGE
jgi:hypothetical protein